MKKILSVLLTLCSISYLPIVTCAKGKSSKETIVSGGQKRTYFLYVPEGLDPRAPAPLIILLHGSNRDGKSLIEKWKELADTERIILAGPNSANSSFWAVPGDGPDFLYDLIEELKVKYRINSRRVYLFGHSAGASFALQVSLLESEYFAATAVHAGALSPEAYPLAENAERKIPLAIFVGTKDPFFPLTLVRSTRTVLTSHGFTVELTEIPNHDHWYYDLAPKINRDAWEFLRKWQLSDEPQYKHWEFKKN